jgi:hypothetical protein
MPLGLSLDLALDLGHVAQCGEQEISQQESFVVIQRAHGMLRRQPVARKISQEHAQRALRWRLGIAIRANHLRSPDARRVTSGLSESSASSLAHCRSSSTSRVPTVPLHSLRRDTALKTSPLRFGWQRPTGRGSEHTLVQLGKEPAQPRAVLQVEPLLLR